MNRPQLPIDNGDWSVTWSPDIPAGRYVSALEAGDSTFVNAQPSFFDELMRTPPANDNEPARPRIIGLMGYGGAGKTAVANILRSEHRFEGPHIKSPLRSMVAQLLRELGISELKIERYLDGDLKRETIPELKRSGTEIQQFIGTEFGRNFCYADLWLDAWLRRVDDIMARGGRVVQESVRFANEADAIRVRGGVIVLVSRPGVGPLPGGHVSEVLPAVPDVVIDNSGSIADLRSRVNDIAA